MRDDAAAKLAGSAISPREAGDAGIQGVSDASQVHWSFAPVPALVLPYYAPDGSKFQTTDGQPFVRVRYLAPVYARPRRGEPKKLVRYAQPPASGLKAYFPWIGDPAGPSAWADVLDDPSIPITITEGELKALCSCLCEVPTIGLGGVYNFATSDGKLLPELAAIIWRGRTVYIAFDSDAVNNPQVAVAEARLIELLMQHGARPALVRLPEGPGGTKQGIDDFVEANGAEAWVRMLESTPPMNAVEKGVIAMNEHVAWIERESKALDMRTHALISAQSMTTGSRFAALRVPVTDSDGNLKPVQTSKLWLTHAYAQRYDDMLFRPSQPPSIHENGKVSFNLWQGFSHEPGDVTPFLELTSFLFSKVRGEAHDLPLKLLAYKAQNPEVKIPLSIILIGLQGCGKSLWGEIIAAAFAPYSVSLRSKALSEEYQGWLEKNLLFVINEVKPVDMYVGAEALRGLISDEDHRMNEKFRVARDLKFYGLGVLTSNSRAVGSFAGDDRRNFVVNCPNKREKAFYARIRKWFREDGGPRRLMDYLLTLDLQEWTPPVEAPMTAEKHMAYHEGLTPVQVVAAKSLESDTSLVVQWLDASHDWAMEAETAGDVRAGRIADEIKRSVKGFQVRPWYSPEELALIFPAITRDLFGNRKVYSTVAGHISRQLRDAGLSYLENRDDPKGFKWRGQWHTFLVVADHDDWREPITQADFDRLMASWPTYGEYRRNVTRMDEIRERRRNEAR